MKTVIVRPERCVGCLQCRFACAVAHSSSRSPYTAIYEPVLSKPRIHIGLSRRGESFPNKCRHCKPAPCEMSCPSAAIYREDVTEAVLINPERCINCGMCAMACPFGVVRFHLSPAVKRPAAHKCDQCILRQKTGHIPACVEVCKAGALLFEDVNVFMKRETDRMADIVYLGIREKETPVTGFSALRAYQAHMEELRRR